MKKLFIAFLCVLFMGLCACGQEISSTTVTTVTEMATTGLTENIVSTSEGASMTSVMIGSKASESELYSEAAKERIEGLENGSNQLADLRYALYDIDGNGTNEFFRGIECGGALLATAIYTIQNGVAVRQEEFWEPDFSRSFPTLLFKNGTIRSGNDNGGELGIIYYRFENGELKRQTTLIDDFGQYYRFNVNVDVFPGTPITKAEFEAVQKEFEGDGQVVELDWKPLAEFGR